MWYVGLGDRDFFWSHLCGQGDGVGGDGGNGVTCDLFEPDRTPMEDL